MRAIRMPARGARADPQAEVPAERKARKRQAGIRKERLQPADRADHLDDAAGMKQLPVERMTAAVVPQVQADHGESVLVQQLRDRQQVQGIGTAFPAVQQDRDPAARRSVDGRGLRNMGEQPHAVSAVEQHFAARRNQGRRTPFHRCPPHRQARQDRLQVAVCKPGRRAEFETQFIQWKSASPPAAW